MLHGYRLECQTANCEYFVRAANSPWLHWPTIDLVPDIGRRVDGARRTRLQSVYMIAVAVREHDGRRSDVADVVQPVRSAIDHHSTASVSHKRGRVPAMASAPDLNVAARAEKCQPRNASYVQSPSRFLRMSLSHHSCFS